MRAVATIPALVRQHAEGAAFLFVQRSREIDGQSFGETDLGRLDNRLAAHLAGLVAAGRTGWEVAREQLGEFPGAGEAFTLLGLAFATGSDTVVTQAVESALTVGGAEIGRGLSGAIAWADRETLASRVRDWLGSGEPAVRLLALCALSHHRADPGPRLPGLLDDPAPALRARAFRLVFELGRTDLRDRCLGVDGFWPAAAAARFGRPDALDPFLCDPGGSRAGFALDLRLVARPEAGRELLRPLLRREESRTLALSRCGVAGDRAVLGWLTAQMEDAELALAAGHAFRDLFPIDIDDTDLFTSRPEMLGGAFAGRDPAPFPIAARVREWADRGAEVERPFVSLRRAMLAALAEGLRSPGGPLPNWRSRRSYPSWV